MRDLVRAEFIKIRSTRTVYGLLLGMAALVTFAVVGSMIEATPEQLAAPVIGQPFMAITGIVLPLFVLVFGLRSFTDEFRHGSIVPTLLGTPDRRAVLVAKVVAATAWSLIFAVAAYAVALGIGIPWMAAEGATGALHVDLLAGLIGQAMLASVIWAALGVGLGLAVRHQVVVIVGSLVWIIVGESIFGGIMPELSKYLPAAASAALTGGFGEVAAPAVGAVALATWTAAALGAGTTLMARRDIA